MKIIEPGHIYELDWLDGQPKTFGTMAKLPVSGFTLRTEYNENQLVFVNREDKPHPGTQTQEVLRALIDRTQHCDRCLRWEGNDKIIKHLRMALALHEARALERKTEKGLLLPEKVATAEDGHFKVHYLFGVRLKA